MSSPDPDAARRRSVVATACSVGFAILVLVSWAALGASGAAATGRPETPAAVAVGSLVVAILAVALMLGAGAQKGSRPALGAPARGAVPLGAALVAFIGYVIIAAAFTGAGTGEPLGTWHAVTDIVPRWLTLVVVLGALAAGATYELLAPRDAQRPHGRTKA